MNAVLKDPSDSIESKFDFREIVCCVCGADDPAVLGWRGGDAHHATAGVRTRIVMCRQCSHIYPNPMPFPALTLDELYTDTEDYFHGHDLEVKKRKGLERMALFEKTLGHRGRYLDIACGRGEGLWAGREAGWEYEGVDVSSTYLAWSQEHLGVTGRLGTLEEAAFPDNYFDAATMNALIEHLYDPFETMSEVFRVLKPGGLLWFDSPNENGLYMRAGNIYMKGLGRDWCVNLAPTFPPYHVQGFTPASLRRLLSRLGFEILKLKVEGEVWPMTGEATIRKRLEHKAARTMAWLGNKTGTGTYMEILVRKPKG